MISHNILNIYSQKVVQDSVEFFIGRLKSSDLLTLSSVTHRRITGYDESGHPLYNDAIQRKPSTTRVKSIKDYLLLDEYSCFPNNIIISVPSIILQEEINQTNNVSILKIDRNKISLSEDNPIYLQIIDGQHRFEGMRLAIESLREENDLDRLQRLEDFEFVVSFFIDAEIDFQAMLFSIINRTPVKVTPDLVYDLFGLDPKDSPQKTALAIALELNGLKKTDEGNDGPFYKRLRLLGKKEKGQNSPLSQGMFIRTIVTLISPSLMLSERERFKDRSDFFFGGNERTIFRIFYANDEDNKIFKVLLNYFLAARNTFTNSEGKSYWDLGDDIKENVFQKTIGFLALIDILIQLFPIGVKEKKLNIDFFSKYLGKAKNIKMFDEKGDSEYPYSSVGRTKLREELNKLIFQSDL